MTGSPIALTMIAQIRVWGIMSPAAQARAWSNAAMPHGMRPVAATMRPSARFWTAVAMANTVANHRRCGPNIGAIAMIPNNVTPSTQRPISIRRQ